MVLFRKIKNYTPVRKQVQTKTMSTLVGIHWCRRFNCTLSTWLESCLPPCLQDLIGARGNVHSSARLGSQISSFCVFEGQRLPLHQNPGSPSSIVAGHVVSHCSTFSHLPCSELWPETGSTNGWQVEVTCIAARSGLHALPPWLIGWWRSGQPWKSHVRDGGIDLNLGAWMSEHSPWLFSVQERDVAVFQPLCSGSIYHCHLAYSS